MEYLSIDVAQILTSCFENKFSLDYKGRVLPELEDIFHVEGSDFAHSYVVNSKGVVLSGRLQSGIMSGVVNVTKVDK